MEYFSYFDLIYAILISIFLIVRANKKKKALIEEHSTYKYYTKGLIAKLIGAFCFCFIYLFYYKGGDTLNYYQGVRAFYNLFWENPSDFYYVMTHDGNWNFYNVFTNATGYPPHYMFRDSRTILVLKLTTILSFPALGGFLSTSVILAKISYSWIWKGFLFIANRYPAMKKQLAFSFLFFPSVIFWGSGIMKDTFTLSACIFSIYGIHDIFIEKKHRTKNTLKTLVAIYIIISIKSYILFAILPGLIIFFNYERIRNIKSTFFKILVVPIILISTIFISELFFSKFANQFGKYSADKILKEAALQQSDLIRDVYGKNSFNIGALDQTWRGAISKAPVAINAALFRPYLWEVGSPTMLISAIENSIILFTILYLAIRIGPINFFKLIFKDAYLIFCLLFTILLAFGIGLSTANFGALVRYRIPFMPFFVSMFFVLHSQIVEEIKQRKKNQISD